VLDWKIAIESSSYQEKMDFQAVVISLPMEQKDLMLKIISRRKTNKCPLLKKKEIIELKIILILCDYLINNNFK
jgi:hypothetical protein|tara:strand:+ start:432 stop:653 length:222 start_codon:yes stop_codon:yes gene_type:complete